MAMAGPFLLSHDIRVHCDNGYNHLLKGVIGNGRSPLFSALSSCALRRDAWSLHSLNAICGPTFRLSSRCSSFQCRSSLLPSGAAGVSVFKTASMVLNRSFSALCGSPTVLQLAPAVGMIAFAVWGIGPLVRLIRIIFLQKNDNSWKKSSTHYVMTSYVQPLILWAGVTLICRVLNPVILPSEASQAVKQRFLNFVRSFSTVLALGYSVSSLIQQTQKFFMETNDTSDGRNMGFQFAGKAIYSAVWVAAVSLFMELLGFSTQKWLTAGGLGTVLLTLAGREIFTNFLSSVMIHATRPFVVNEWIQTKIEGYEVSGTIEHVGWWSPTIVRGDDREAIHIPNHKFTMSVVRNLSQKTHWRIKTYLAISHLDVNKINSIVADMRKVLAKNPQVEQQRLHRRVFLENINPENQALMILVSCFVKTSHFEEYLCVKEAILLDLLRVISHHRARLATPIRTIQKIYSEADVENVPFADTIFNRSGAVGNRPLLLIEPSYKINADDRPKPSASSVCINEDRDAKVEATFSSGSNKDDAKDESIILEVTKNDSSVSSSLNLQPMSDPKKPKTISSSSTQGSEKQQLGKKVVGSKLEGVAGDTPEDASSGPTTVEKPLRTSREPSRRTDGPSSAHAKQESGRTVVSTSTMRPSLEDNIVLGVALEGSKRTLPIEEEMIPSTAHVESKELAACRNGNGSTTVEKDKKEDQVSAVPSITSQDQRDRAR